MPRKLSKNIIAQTFNFDCDRFLRLSLATDDEINEFKLSDLGKRPGIQLLKEAGKYWEAKKYHDLIRYKGNNIIKNPNENGEKFYPVTDLPDKLNNEIIPFGIIEGEFIVSNSIFPSLENIYNEYGLKKVKARPDFLWILPYSEDEFLLDCSIIPENIIKIVDIKLTADPSLKHFTEVTYYAFAFKQFLKENGLSNKYGISNKGYIWPGSHDFNSFSKLVDKKNRDGDTDSLNNSLKETLIEIPFDIYKSHIFNFFEKRLPNVLKQNIHETNWFITQKCQLCQYLEFCKDEAENKKLFCQIPWMNEGLESALKEKNINNMEEFHQELQLSSSEEDHNFVELEKNNYQWRASKHEIIERVKSIYSGDKKVINNRRTYSIPKWSDQKIYITIHFDPGSGLSFAMAIKRVILNSDLKEEINKVNDEKEYIVDRYINDNYNPEKNRFKELLNDLNSWLLEVHEANKKKNNKYSSQIYFWDTLEMNQFIRMLERYMNDEELIDKIDNLLNLFPVNDNLPNPDLYDNFPFSILKNYLKNIIALPLKYDYSLFKTANILFTGNVFRLNKGFSTPMSDQIPFERAYELWWDKIYLKKDGREVSLEFIRDNLKKTLKKHLSAMVSIDVNISRNFKDTCSLKKKKFALYETNKRSMSKRSKKMFTFNRLNEITSKIESNQNRILPVEEREAKFFSMKVNDKFSKEEKLGIIQKYCETNPDIDTRDLLVLSLDETSQESKIREGEFLLTISNEDFCFDYNDRIINWANTNGKSEILLELIGNLYDNANNSIIYSICIGKVFQVTLLNINISGNSSFIILQINNPGLFNIALKIGLIDLSKPLIIDPYYRDFSTEKLKKILSTIGKKGRGRQDYASPAYEILNEEINNDDNSFNINLSDLHDIVISSVKDNKRNINIEQKSAIKKSFENIITLLWGPPGTGKTTTLAWIILSWIIYAEQNNLEINIGIGAQNYNAIDNVLYSILELIDNFDILPNTTFFRIRSKSRKPLKEQKIIDIEVTEEGSRKLNNEMSDINIIAGTWQQFYKIKGFTNKIKNRDEESTYKLFDLLIIDEATQVPVSQTASYLLLLKEKGHILLAGDEKQLGPIYKFNIQNDEESLFDCIFTYIKKIQKIEPVQLIKNYRTNSEIAEYPERRFYPNGYEANDPKKKLNIGDYTNTDAIRNLKTNDCWSEIYKTIIDPEYPIVVITYNDYIATLSNHFESTIVSMTGYLYFKLLQENDETNNFFRDKFGVVTPHRAQISTIKNDFKAFADFEIPDFSFVDTVNRFQGLERDLIVSSYCVSDKEVIRNEEEFIYNPRRFNVTLTRARSKFILLISEKLLEYIPSDIEIAKDSSIIKQFVFDYCKYLNETQIPYLRSGQIENINTKVYVKKRNPQEEGG